MNDPLAARFEALLEPGTPDWLDVHRRARRRSRRLWLIAAVAAVFLAIPTVAIALDPTILPWNSAAPASSSVVKSFASMVSGAPPGMDPHAKPGEARKIPLVDGGIVWVAPAANGGFCELFKAPYSNGGCDQTRGFPISDSVGITVRCGTHPRTVPPYLVNGHVIAKAGSTLELDFSDGTSVSLPLTWVGPLIDAGFYEYSSNKPMAALVLRDPGGSLIEKETKVFEDTYKTRFAGCRPPSG